MRLVLLVAICESIHWCLCEVSLRGIKGYNKDIMPYNDEHAPREPLNVSLQIYINNMIPLEKKDMHYFVDILVRQYWIDPRLSFEKLNIQGDQTILFNEKISERIWKPDIFFVNSKDAVSHKTTLPNRVFMLSRNGGIFYSHRVSMQVYCKMILTNFPFDKQRCELLLSSYGHSDKFMNLAWNTANNGPVFEPSLMSTLEFTLTNVEYHKQSVKLLQGNTFDRLVIHFTFERNYVYYILQMYLPAILIVMLSWVGFWIDYRSTPARASLGITAVLTMVTLGNSIRTTIPQSNYLKSIDVYNIICLCFIFITVIEFAFILTIENEWKVSKKKKDAQKRKKFIHGKLRKRKQNIVAKQDPNVNETSDNNVAEEPTNLFIPNQEQLNKLENLHKREKKKIKIRSKVMNSKAALEDRLLVKQRRYQETHLVDRFMRKLMPLLFCIFNLSYFYFSLR